MISKHPLLRSAGRHMAKHDKALSTEMAKLEPLPVFPLPGSANSHFHSLAKTILYQQLAGNAAKTIHDRVRRLGVNGRFPTPHRFLALENEMIRACGVSAPKQAAIRDLASRIETGRLSLRALKYMDDDEIIKQLTTVRGIGPWSAQMFLIFRLGRTDVLPSGDLGVQEGLRIMDGLEIRPTAAQLEERSRIWKPFRSFATWTLYRVVDEHRLKP